MSSLPSLEGMVCAQAWGPSLVLAAPSVGWEPLLGTAESQVLLPRCPWPGTCIYVTHTHTHTHQIPTVHRHKITKTYTGIPRHTKIPTLLLF